jgi:hypothetical protein
VAVAGLWVRGYWFHDDIHYGAGQLVKGAEYQCRDVFFDSSQGRLYVWGVGVKSSRGPIRNVPAAGWQYQREVIDPANPPRWYGDDQRTLGIGYLNEFRSSGHHVVSVGAPSWQVFLVTTMLPAAWWFRRRRRFRVERAGLCASCGYDLRATPERCPECGTIPVR